MNRPPERTEGTASTCVIPHASGDNPSGPGDATHLGQPRHRVTHEMDDELRERNIEGVTSERQILGRRGMDVDFRKPGTDGLDEGR